VSQALSEPVERRRPAAAEEPNLLGIDVGFAANRHSTGLAWRVGGRIATSLTGSDWATRSAALPTGTTFDLAAFDAPLVPANSDIARRSCEATFYRGAFAKRCRPGMSHFGQGLEFRRAGAAAADQFRPVISDGFRPANAAIAGAAMVEAFPNTFLGVLLPEDVLDDLPAKRSGKSDRLYEACLAGGAFARLVQELAWPLLETLDLLAGERDHDIRAAYVCLFTAGFAHAGTATVVGDHLGGWFWLPPMGLWAKWARDAVVQTAAAARRRGYPDLVITHTAYYDQDGNRGGPAPQSADCLETI
jgi:hypothetical protein